MVIRYTRERIDFSGKHLTQLDHFVIRFVRVLERHAPYVIVSGYVAILFGRARGTEDIDILVPRLGGDQFAELHAELSAAGYEFLNAEPADCLHDMLSHRMGIRIAEKDRYIPNIELNFFKDDVDQTVFHERVGVVLPGATLFVSPIEIQIAYKVYLGSDKDVEDAMYLREIFSRDLDRQSLNRWLDFFGVRGDMNETGV
jgi:hypothetical protein